MIGSQTLNRSPGLVRIRFPALTLLALCSLRCLPCLAGSQPFFSSSKAIQFDLDKDAQGNPVGGEDTALFRGLTYVFADDKEGPMHRGQLNRPESCWTDPFEGRPVWNLVHDGAVADDVVVRGETFWPGYGGFDKSNPPYETITYPVLWTETSHFYGQGSFRLEYILSDSRESAEAEIGIGGMIEIQMPLHPDETAVSEIWSGLEFSTTGQVAATAITGGKTPTQRIGIQGSQTVRGLVADPATSPNRRSKAQSAVFTPLSLAYYDEVTGGLIASQELFTSQLSVEDNALVQFETRTGLRLQSDSQSLARAKIETRSSWVLNPFQGEAWISDGQFHATGDLFNQPWDITTSGGVTTARLAPEAFRFAFDLEVQASGLGTPLHNLVSELRSVDRGTTYLYATVPEPSTFVLLGISALAWGAYQNLRRGAGR